ncbi:MAG: acetyl-CoA carboxylase, carboxyltransferase subunit beta [Coxiellaceae bacterium]|jgi:acetyl-CoA carboxylase carboxyl transferase subunit beta|nr:acetyl-CoA carboxylase, carboxyltransferase subunit beta [Coxiellaceae bacterium]
MSWFKQLISKRIYTGYSERKSVPDGIWAKCNVCNVPIYHTELERNLFVCFKCDYHFRITARERIDVFLDKSDRVELAQDIESVDRLKFKDSKKYKDRLLTAQKETGEKDALIVMKGSVKNIPIVSTFFDFNFIGGSMGAAVGEKFVVGVDTSLSERLPLINFAASGGARMQEGLISLMQMAKTSAALTKLASEGIPFISVLTDPTTGGVAASLANLGDIILAEPGALIGFAGQRVIEQTMRQQLPEGFQKSHFLLDHGAIDMIVPRRKMRDTIASLLSKLLHLEQPPVDED